MEIVKMITQAGSGHPAGSLGMADVFSELYFGKSIKYNPSNPDWENRDRLILSNELTNEVASAYRGKTPLTFPRRDFTSSEVLRFIRPIMPVAMVKPIRMTANFHFREKRIIWSFLWIMDSIWAYPTLFDYALF